jgi:lipopolysaccharide export system permease protein
MSGGRRRVAPFGMLDRYVGRVFVVAYLLATLLVVGLFLVVDLAGNLDDYLKPTSDGEPTPGAKVLHYYGLQLPFLYLQVAPFVTLIAGMFTVAKLQKAREVIAALAAGISARRLLAPVFIGGLLLTIGVIALREVASSTIGFERGVLQVELDEHLPWIVLEDVRLKDSQGEMIQLERFWPIDPELRAETGPWARRVLRGSRIEGFNAVRDRDGTWLSYSATSGVWEGGDGRSESPGAAWRLLEGRLVEVGASSQDQRELRELDGAMAFTPRDAWVAWKGRNNPLDLSYSEAVSLADRDPENIQYRTLRYYLLSFPLANVVLLMVGLPFLLNYERGRGTNGMIVGFLLCVVYFATDFVTLNLGMQGQIGPVFACGLPAVVFGSLGLVLTGSMRT